jgi:hypothetical protein
VSRSQRRDRALTGSVGQLIPKGQPRRPYPDTLTAVDRTISERLEAARYEPPERPWHPDGSPVGWTSKTRAGVSVFASSLDRLLAKLAVAAREERDRDEGVPFLRPS